MKKVFNRLTSFALTVGMLLSSAPSFRICTNTVAAEETTAALEDVHIWNGTSDVSWYDDQDTEFHISTPEQLAGWSELSRAGKTMEGKTIILDKDLYMNDVSKYDEWVAGNSQPNRTFYYIDEFRGKLLGNNHCIVGLDGSLIYYLNGGFVSELNLVDRFTNSKPTYNPKKDQYYNLKNAYNGGFIGHSNESTIQKCSVQGDMIIEVNKYAAVTGIFAYGGLVGYSSNDEIVECNNAINITITSNNEYRCPSIGGICGVASGSKIIACSNSGNIYTDVYAVVAAAGVCCGAINSSYVTQCKNTGSITVKSREAGGARGVCGGGDSSTKVKNCYNTGDVYGNSAAGISSDGIVENVYNTGVIKNGTAGQVYIYAISDSAKTINAYYLTGTAPKGSNSDPDYTIAKNEANMKKESFADALGDAFYYVEGEYPKLAFEVGRTVSELDKTNLVFREFGETQDLSLITSYLGKPEWVSSDTSVATVDDNGIVTAVGNGTAMIYALCGDSQAACSVTVGYDYYLSDNEFTLKTGRVRNLTVYSASDQKKLEGIDVEWSSTDDSIVSVDENGKITANAVGTAAVTAKLISTGIELNCVVNVYEYQVPVNVTLDKENLPKLSETEFTISSNSSKLLTVDKYNDTITWVSADTSVAKVNKNGLVKGVAEGKTEIYALLSDGICLKATATITKSEFEMGDVNLDGKFDVTDVITLQKWILAMPDAKLKNWENADFYEDGLIDVYDLALMKKKLISK